jgi:DNA (cytosine-5)-methyltransferase 1
VLGGPPCQGFSQLGKRQPKDPRNHLWRKYAETLEIVQPLYFVMENVANFLRASQFGELEEATGPRGILRNYRIEPMILNAADYGVPQNRKRAIVIGSRRDLPPVGRPIARTPEGSASRATVRTAIADLPLLVDGVDLPSTSTQIDGMNISGPFKTVELHLGRRPTSLSLERYRHIPPGGNRHNIPTNLLAPCWVGHNSGSGDVMGRLHWDKPSVTIRTEFWKPEKGRYLHPVADRPITHHEAARLQGFPDDYLWLGSKADIGRQIGNAVPVELAASIAEYLTACIANFDTE